MSITSHRITELDWPILEEAIKNDNHLDKGYTLFFYEPGTCCNVWEYKSKPILFCRGKLIDDKAVWLNVQFVNNNNKRKNAVVIYAMVTDLIETLTIAGFKDLQFKSDSSELVEFCKKKFGFVEVDGILHRILEA